MMDHSFDRDIPFFAVFARTNDGMAGDEVPRAGDSVPYAAASDQELVTSFLQGDDASFAALLERHLPIAYKFTYRYLQNADDTNDVVQEVFIKAWKHMKKFDQGRNFRTWLLTIAKNTALDFIKKKRPILFSKIEEGAGDLDSFLAPYLAAGEGADLPDEVLERKEMRSLLDGALQELSPSYRTVLTLRYVEHLKFREIAEILQEPIDTVKSKHRRGVILLQKALGGVRADFSF